HEPPDCAEVIKTMLAEEGLKVYLEHGTEALADPSVPDLSLVVPIMTMSKIEQAEVTNLATAIESGVGIAGYHSGAGDA
ncbi:ThuA domain-containing protein, partial [Rhizobium leguminosarum]|uniref:ThuA domain-containing protein n=1 Tax=Rhizobium leguminosarum TaxID=384 RepID=UPI003F9590E0